MLIIIYKQIGSLFALMTKNVALQPPYFHSRL